MGTAIALGCFLAVIIGGVLLACHAKGSEGAVTDNRPLDLARGLERAKRVERQPGTGNCRPAWRARGEER